MLYFFRRPGQLLISETRLNPDGAGYQLVITEAGDTRIEPFATVAEMLAREHELLQLWREQGWTEDTGSRQPPLRRLDDWNV